MSLSNLRCKLSVYLSINFVKTSLSLIFSISCKIYTLFRSHLLCLLLYIFDKMCYFYFLHAFSSHLTIFCNFVILRSTFFLRFLSFISITKKTASLLWIYWFSQFIRNTVRMFLKQPIPHNCFLRISTKFCHFLLLSGGERVNFSQFF